MVYLFSLISSEQKAFNNTPIQTIDFLLEGGSIETDGQGTLLTTRSCLLTATRNAGLSEKEIEKKLKEYLSIERILWLDVEPLAGDDTDGHIDTLARFVDAETICYCHCCRKDDSHQKPLQALQKQLSEFKTQTDKYYTIIPLPLPKPIYNKQQQRLPASYANFLIINEAVLVPTYDDPSDDIALEALQICFPNRKIISIPCLPLIQQFGGLHCASMQLRLNETRLESHY